MAPLTPVVTLDWKTIKDSNLSTNSYEVTGLTNGTVYYFRMRSIYQTQTLPSRAVAPRL